MSHITSKSYQKLQERLDKSPQGTPASDSLFKILEVLFSEEEAELVSKLPIKPVTAKKAAKRWEMTEQEAKKHLDELADKGLVFDTDNGTDQVYLLAPPMAGFFEFSLMRTDGKFDRKILSELFHQYINHEEGFLHSVLGQEPAIARTLVHEDMIQEKDMSEVLDYERASNVIKTADCITVGTCYCRHKMEHLGKACDQRQDVCLTFNGAAKSLAKHGIAREISKDEAYEILDDCIKKGLVQIGDNVQNRVGWICNCCGCCCEALLAYKRLGCNMRVKTNFVADFMSKDCNHCGLCSLKCPVDAIKMVNDRNGKKVPEIDSERCLGCGVCARFCPTKGIIMKRREQIGFVPKDSFERFVLSAIEQGKLQNLLFDNFDLWTHDVLRRLLKYILDLSPVKRRLANQQLRSRYIDKIAKTYFVLDKKLFNGKKPDYTHPELK